MTDLNELFRRIFAGKKEEPLPPVEWLIVGLGNPGDKYRGTRHNAGYVAIDAIAEKAGVKIDRAAHKGLTGRGALGGHGVLFLKPETYMNLSGEAVRDAAAFYKIPPEKILILCDDISFEPGRIRIRRSGSHGGHNGLRNITDQLGSDAFPRIRIGVGQKPHPEYDLVDWVLGKLPPDDAKKIADRAADFFDAATLIASGQIETAMNRYSH
ncbi:MAG: aminoacyl-tRNA hydrolase [Clostridia bacterium]|nr:aminoacyl-tRNA hydrolase [Clostridia bacterium]